MQYTDRYLSSDGLRIHYLDWTQPGGENKQPLLLLHGIGRTAHNYDHLVPHLSRRFRVYAADLRGHGESGWHPQAAYLGEDYVRDIEALIAQLGLQNLVLMGQSTGGRVVQVIAGKLPGLVAAAIVEDVGPERPKEISDRRARRTSDEGSGWASRDAILAAMQARYPRTSAALVSHFVDTAARQGPDGRWVWKHDPDTTKGFVPTEIWDHVRNIEAPLIYILGGASAIVPEPTQARLREMLPQVQFVTMDGLGHYPCDEQPAEFLQIVDGFLE